MSGSIPPAPGRIFISYRREEAAYPAGWLFDRLADRYGAGQIFKDVDSIELGEDFVEVITRAVGSCDVLLALIGPQWLTIADEHGQRRLDSADDFVRLEIEAALTRKVLVIPILVDGARMPRPDELPDSLATLVRRHALELSPTRFAFDTSQLLKVLDKTLAGVQIQREPEEEVEREGAGKRSETRTGAPRLELSPSEVDFGRLQVGGPSPQRSVQVRNTGGGSLNARIAEVPAWARAEQAGPNIVLVIDPAVVGSLTGDVVVHSDGGPATIRISAQVDPSPFPAPEPQQAERRLSTAPAGPRPATRVSRRPRRPRQRWWHRRVVWVMLIALTGVAGTTVAIATGGRSARQAQLVNLSPVGDAVRVGDRLRLTAPEINQRGAAWSTEQRKVQQPFTATFQFQITNPDARGGADGLAFVIQNYSRSSLGDNGGGIGYHGIPNSVAVEFDTSRTPQGTPPMTIRGDPSDHHIGVHTGGNGPNSADEELRIGTIHDEANPKDGRPHTARVRYSPGRMDVYLDDLDTPALTVPLNLATTLRLTNGAAWIGLTAATGTRVEQHEVWSLTWQPA